MSDNGDVFDDGNIPPCSRSTESGFTDFVQYHEDGPEDPERASDPHLRAVCRPTGSCQSKPLDKPVMQCCLEHFQQFLSCLITFSILSERVDKVEGRGELLQSGPLVSAGSQPSNYTESCSGAGMVQKDCVTAFTAACQLFLECSSFPVYIAEGNLKSSPVQEEQCGKSVSTSRIYLRLVDVLMPSFICTDSEQVLLPVWLQTLMDACCRASDFSLQGVAISLLMDLIGLTQSVAMVTAESQASSSNTEPAQPVSPSQGRVAVVIRPPLTQGILKYIADKTDFFKVDDAEVSPQLVGFMLL